MKIEDKNDEVVLTYNHVNSGQCFMYENHVYMKCYDGGLNNCIDVDMETGHVSQHLRDNISVKPLPNAILKIHGE